MCNNDDDDDSDSHDDDSSDDTNNKGNNDDVGSKTATMIDNDGDEYYWSVSSVSKALSTYSMN